MAIQSINVNTTGLVDVDPRRVEIKCTDSLSTITTAGYLNPVNAQGFTIKQTDQVVIAYTGGSGSTYTVETFGVSIASSTGIITLTPSEGGVIGTPTVGDFAVFANAMGGIQDLGYLPSNAAKTNVVMATGPVTVGNISTYTDTAGTIGQNAATAINGGNIQAGLSGTAGTLISYPSTASKGSLIVAGVANTGNTNTTISNAAMAQASVISIPDPGIATANFALNNVGITNTVQITLNLASITGMYATPVQLIAAIANNSIFITSLQANYIGGSAAFTSGGIIVVQYGNSAHGAGTTATSGASISGAGFLTGGTTNQYLTVTGINNSASGTGANSSGVINTGIFISNQTAAFATGTGGSMIITVSYVAVPMS
jgi:hypothetical protein